MTVLLMRVDDKIIGDDMFYIVNDITIPVGRALIGETLKGIEVSGRVKKGVKKISIEIDFDAIKNLDVSGLGDDVYVQGELVEFDAWVSFGKLNTEEAGTVLSLDAYRPYREKGVDTENIK